ncbi:hypothetical protein J6590_106072 [Homalodisca vitripennis]|nr:hypothetical protein J6590_106072 [Homalodisca vitripennis]
MDIEAKPVPDVGVTLPEAQATLPNACVISKGSSSFGSRKGFFQDHYSFSADSLLEARNKAPAAPETYLSSMESNPAMLTTALTSNTVQPGCQQSATRCQGNVHRCKAQKGLFKGHPTAPETSARAAQTMDLVSSGTLSESSSRSSTTLWKRQAASAPAPPSKSRRMDSVDAQGMGLSVASAFRPSSWTCQGMGQPRGHSEAARRRRPLGSLHRQNTPAENGYSSPHQDCPAIPAGG